MVKKLWRYVKPFSSASGTSRTDGQTYKQTDLLYQYRASVCWRAIKNCACTIEATKLTTDRHEATRGLFATAELLAYCPVMSWLYFLAIAPSSNPWTDFNRLWLEWCVVTRGCLLGVWMTAHNFKGFKILNPPKFPKRGRG